MYNINEKTVYLFCYFQIVFEGEVGRNSLGNIAIDDISVAPGVCPTAPQVRTLFKKVNVIIQKICACTPRLTAWNDGQMDMPKIKIYIANPTLHPINLAPL